VYESTCFVGACVYPRLSKCVCVCVCVCNCMGTNKSVNEPLMSCNHTHTAVLF